VKCIVGLGNPGRKYEMTRHNIGFLVLDELAKRHRLCFRRSLRFSAQLARGRIGSERVLLIKPQLFMNRSGQAIGPILRKEGAQADNLLMVFDDVALEWGQLRLRAQGSDGGHNGVRSVLSTLGEDAFDRIRVGIGLKPDKVSLSGYVLGLFSATERRELEEVVQRAVDAIEGVCSTGIDRAMNDFNRG